MTPRPYSRMFQAVGTAGYAAKYPVPEVQLSPEMAAKVGIEMEDDKLPLNASQIETLLKSLCAFFPFRDNCLSQRARRTWRNVLFYGLTACSMPTTRFAFRYGCV